MARILIVDDLEAIRKTLAEILTLQNYEVDEAVDGLAALAKLKRNTYDVIILDVKMPNMDGLEALDRIAALKIESQVIMMSAHGDIETALVAVRKGAYDFIQKPVDLNRLLITIRNAMDRSMLVTETKVLKTRVRNYKTQEIIGESKAIMEIKDMIEKVAPSDSRILITGSNGTGKELVARWVHEKSPRSSGPIIEVNCAAIPSELIESELFGHEKGSFTGAYKQKIGKFEQANGGTLFLDEIGDMSLSAQAKVLRALQEHKITRVGGDKEIKVNVRVIAATNKNLTEEIKNRNFREDLYHRVAVIPIHVPSLNDRADDIPLLVNHFLTLVCNEQGIPVKTIEETGIKALQNYEWTGNIRELRNIIERLVILSHSTIITEAEVYQHVTRRSSY